jgi:hypothetical protein
VNRPDALPLDGRLAVAVETCSCNGAHYTDTCEALNGVAVSWCIEARDGARHGGAYVTHAGAAETIRTFRDHFPAGSRIVPCHARRDAAGRYTYARIAAEPLWPEVL